MSAIARSAVSGMPPRSASRPMSLARRSAPAVLAGRIAAVQRQVAGRCQHLRGELRVVIAAVAGIFSTSPASRRPARFSNTVMNAAGSSFLTAARMAAEYTDGEPLSVLLLVLVPVLGRPHRLDRQHGIDARPCLRRDVPLGRRRPRHPVQRGRRARQVAQLPVDLEGALEQLIRLVRQARA